MISRRDLYVVKSLIRYARLIGPDRRTHFCAATRKKTIVCGHNTYEKSGSRDVSKYYPYLAPHAEYVVLSQLENPATLYVIRLDKKLSFLNSRPCSACQRLIRNHKVRHVVYSIDGGLIKEKVK